MKKEDAKVGLKVQMYDGTSGDTDIIVFVGIDPHEDKWVVACPNWALGISHVEDDDWESMKPYEGGVAC